MSFEPWGGEACAQAVARFECCVFLHVPEALDRCEQVSRRHRAAINFNQQAGTRAASVGDRGGPVDTGGDSPQLSALPRGQEARGRVLVSLWPHSQGRIRCCLCDAPPLGRGVLIYFSRPCGWAEAAARRWIQPVSVGDACADNHNRGCRGEKGPGFGSCGRGAEIGGRLRRLRDGERGGSPVQGFVGNSGCHAELVGGKRIFCATNGRAHSSVGSPCADSCMPTMRASGCSSRGEPVWMWARWMGTPEEPGAGLSRSPPHGLAEKGRRWSRNER